MEVVQEKVLCRYIYYGLILLILLVLPVSNASGQYKFRYDNDNFGTLDFAPEHKSGFRASVSIVAMFTAGVADRSGIRLGAGITLSQTIGDWKLLTGFDTYKANQAFGLGTAFAGLVYDDRKYGGSYYVNRYFQGDKQVSGIVNIHLRDFYIRFEDDILAMPFTGFTIYDRFRTSAIELQYKGFIVGTNVYTTDINGVTDISDSNSRGVYASGRQLSSPVYIGYTDKSLILRYGLNSKFGGIIGQNGWHRLFFGTPDFKYGNYKNQFLQIGIDKPYTLY